MKNYCITGDAHRAEGADIIFHFGAENDETAKAVFSDYPWARSLWRGNAPSIDGLIERRKYDEKMVGDGLECRP